MTALASSFISNSWISSWLQRMRPSRMVHSLASRLLTLLIFLRNPFAHLPWSSRMSPPPPAGPGQPKAEPSIFNLNQPGLGRFDLTWINFFPKTSIWGMTRQENSDARISTSLIKEGLRLECWKLHLFLWSHRFQIPKRKKVSQVKDLLGMALLLRALDLSYLLKGEEKNSGSLAGIPALIQKLLATW